MLVVILSVLSIILAGIYLFFTWNNGYWKKHGVPHEQPKFFFGNFKEALTGTKHFGLIYNDIYKKFDNAAYFGFYKLRTPTLVIRDLELIKAVLVKDYNHFAENDFHTDTEADRMLAVNPFFRVGEDWKTRRAQWSALLTPSRVKAMFPVMVEKADRMVDYLRTRVKEAPGKPLEVRKLAVSYLTDVAVSGVLGLQINTFVDEDNVFKRLALSFFESDFWEGLKILSYIVAPWIHTYFTVGFVKPWVKKECLDIAKNIIAIRKKHGFLQNDFFESLMKNGEEDPVEIAGRALGFLSEGVETSSGLVSFVLYEMAANPHIQTKLREELNGAAEANGGQLSFDDIQGNKYLDMITNEVMRIYPAVLAVNRMCTEEYTLPPATAGGAPFRVPRGMPVTVCNYATHHDAAYFPDPEAFDPERFRDEAAVPKFAFLPFGEGPRICVGSRLGLVNSKVAICSIIRNFELRLSSKTKPRPLPIDPTVLVTRAVGDLWLTFHGISAP